MKEIKRAIILMLSLACFLSLGNSLVTTYDVGVKVGYLKYDLSLSTSVGKQSYSESAHLIVNITNLAISTETIQQKTTDSWEITEPFQAGETLILEIKAGGDWGSIFAAGSSQTYPVQLYATLNTSSGGEATFSIWYQDTTLTPSGGIGTPILTPLNATAIDNNASESLEPVQNALGEASCLVKTNVTVTATLNQTQVYDNFGPVSSNGAPISPPELSLLTDENVTIIAGTAETSDVTGYLPTGLTGFSTGITPFSIDTSTWSSGPIIPSGLNVNDTVPGFGGATVLSLTDWNGRTAVVVSPSQFTPGSSALFDRETGVLLEANGSTSQSGYSVNFSYKLTDTSLFSITPLGTAWSVWVVVIVLIGCLIVGGTILMVRRRKPSQPAPPPPVTTAVGDLPDPTSVRATTVVT